MQQQFFWVLRICEQEIEIGMNRASVYFRKSEFKIEIIASQNRGGNHNPNHEPQSNLLFIIIKLIILINIIVLLTLFYYFYYFY